jgi:hypothetical protein
MSKFCMVFCNQEILFSVFNPLTSMVLSAPEKYCEKKIPFYVSTWEIFGCGECR